MRLQQGPAIGTFQRPGINRLMTFGTLWHASTLTEPITYSSIEAGLGLVELAFS